MTKMKLPNGRLAYIIQKGDQANVDFREDNDVQNMILDTSPTLQLSIGEEGRIYDATGTPLENEHFEPLSGVKPKRWPYYLILNQSETQSITQAEYDRLSPRKKHRYHFKPCIPAGSIEAPWHCCRSEENMANYEALKKLSESHQIILMAADHDAIVEHVYFSMIYNAAIAKRYKYEYGNGNPVLKLAEYAVKRAEIEFEKRALDNWLKMPPWMEEDFIR